MKSMQFDPDCETVKSRRKRVGKQWWNEHFTRYFGIEVRPQQRVKDSTFRIPRTWRYEIFEIVITPHT